MSKPARKSSATTAPQISADPTREATRSLYHYELFGFVSVLALVGGFGWWSATTEIAGAAIAPGSVVVEGNSKKVQHLEGGIVAALEVKNADIVVAGQPLLRLDATETRASLQITQGQIEELQARRARLIAERDGARQFDPASLTDVRRTNDAVWIGQTKLFEARRSQRADREAQFNERIVQLQEAGKGLWSQMRSKEQQLNYLRDEIEGLLQLAEQQLVTKPRLLAMQRELAKLDGERGQIVADMARTQVQVSETRLQIAELRQTFLSEVLAELRDAETKLAEQLERETAALAKLRRLVVLSPIGGVVHKLNVTTIGGVITPADTLMEIVPTGERLLVEGQLDPASIDQVKVGQDVLIRISALDQRVTPEIIGRLASVSADVRQDAPQLPRYYAVRAHLEDGEVEKLGGSRLVPGMPAELIIRHGDRTVLNYLVKPLLDRLAHAFRER